MTPANIEAEQQLLGALLGNADLFPRVADLVSERDFYDPIHGELFRAIRLRVDADQIVSPVAMREWAENAPGMTAVGGGRYLINLMAGSVSSSAVAHYAGIVADLSRKRQIAEVLSRGLERVNTEDTAAAIAEDVEGALSAFQGADRDRAPVAFMRAVTDAVAQAMDAMDGKEQGVRTGIKALDRIMGPMLPGQLVLLGGRPSMGKSAVALGVALNVARSGQGVVIASLEMTPESMAQRAVSEAMSVRGRALSYADMSRGLINQAQLVVLKEAAREVAELPIQILPTSYRDVLALTAGVKRARAQMGGCGLVVVDYLQLLTAQGKDRFEKIAEISIALKGLAMRLGVPVLALSQLSRAVESRDDKRPVLSDLRESGQLEQDADAVLFCYRPAYYLERDRPEADASVEDFDQWQAEMDRKKHVLEIIVAKQRQGGIGTATVGFAPEYNRLWDFGN